MSKKILSYLNAKNVERLYGDFGLDFDYMVKRIFIDKQPTAFARYNEGEFGLISKVGFRGAGGYRKTYVDLHGLSDDLRESLQCMDADYFYGIASSQHVNANRFYKDAITSENKTFATLFVNNNWKRWNGVLHSIRESVVLIANIIGEEKKNDYPFKVSEYFGVPFDVVAYYENNKDLVMYQCRTIARKYKNKLIFFCAGPLSNLMISECWKLNKTNRYIDIGSTLDEYVMGRKTRNYFHETSHTFNRVDYL